MVERRPLISTSVRWAPRARSDTVETPDVVAPEPLESWVAPAVEVAEMVRRSSSVLCTPDREMSCRVMLCTGKAVSSSTVRLIDDPVTSILSS